MDLSKLYEEYGKLMVQREILEVRINETKSQIAQVLKQPPIKKEDKT